MDKPKEWTKKDLRAFRESMGWTQKQLAEKLGVVALSISRYETGRRRISKIIARLLDKLWTEKEQADQEQINRVLENKVPIVTEKPMVKKPPKDGPINKVSPEELKHIYPTEETEFITEKKKTEIKPKAQGIEMTGEDIREGDILLVDLEGRPENGSYVLLVYKKNFYYVRKYQKNGNVSSYIPINEKQTDNVDFSIRHTDRFLIRGFQRTFSISL